MNPCLSRAMLLLGVPLATAIAPPVLAQSSASSAAGQATSALDQLDAWLGDGDSGDRWRTFLRIDGLRAELAKGVEADPALVAGSLHQFMAEVPGLELPPFVAARDALRGWLTSLKRQYQDDLVRLAWASRGDHVPVDRSQFAAARAELRARATTLNQALGRYPSIVAGWKNYLRWEQLDPHLVGNDFPTAETLAKLEEVLHRLRNNYPGLERPEFTGLARAIERYRALAAWAVTASRRDTRQIYELYLADLGRFLKQNIERPSVETTRQIARLMGRLDGLGQSPELVQAMRRRYARPNIFGMASAHFVGRMPQTAVAAAEPVRDFILGTSIVGTANTMRHVRYSLEPSSDSIQLAVYLEGTAQSRTRGYHSPVVINSTGQTTFHAVKRITLRDDGFTSASASASVDTRTRIRSIRKTGGQLGRRLVEKIAWQRALEQKRQAELISARHTEQRILREFDSIVARDLAAAWGRYDQRVRAPLVRRGVSPEYLRLTSAPTGVAIETVFARRNQLAAPGPPPPLLPGQDLALQLHESAVNNYLPLALASARIAQQSADNPPDLSGNVPAWLKALAVARPNLASAASAGVEIVQEAQERIADAVGVEPEVTPPPFKPYSITLNAEAPASVQFDDNQIRVRVRAAVLSSDEREYTNWDFVVTYAITRDGDRIILRRTGNIEVYPTDFDPAWPTSLSAEQSGFRNVLFNNINARAKAGQSFPQEIPIEPVRISRFGVVVLRQLTADDGWLTVGWTLP